MKPVDIGTLDKIVNKTIAIIEKGKEQIFDIADNAMQERVRLKDELEILKKETLETIDAVDRLEVEERNARIRLMEVSKNFHRYSEEEAQAAYEYARNLQLQLGLMRERERQLRLRRDQLEVSLRRLDETIIKAETLVSQVGVALSFLKNELQGLSTHWGEMQQRQTLGIKVIKAQEEERKRVAREIHDGPAQSMANLVLRAELCTKLLDIDVNEVKGELQGLKDMVKASLQDVRKIVFDLRPMALDDLGIVPTLRRYVTEFRERAGTPVELAVSGTERRLPEGLEIALFRIIQEALNNVAKHAQAYRAQVRLELMAQTVNLIIFDDGKGFVLEDIMAGKSPDCYGLMGMRERVELLEGKMRINTAPDRGTQILIQIPIKEGVEIAAD